MNVTIHSEEKRIAELQRQLQRIEREGWKFHEPPRRRTRRLRSSLAAVLVALARRLAPTSPAGSPPVPDTAARA